MVRTKFVALAMYKQNDLVVFENIHGMLIKEYITALTSIDYKNHVKHRKVFRKIKIYVENIDMLRKIVMEDIL